MVFDLEFNQGYNFKKENISTINPKFPFEIIDIGAIKLDENLNTILTFDKLIKPSLYKKLHPFIKDMTGISRESLKSAELFNEVYKEFSKFISDVDILCVWGTADIKELIRNIEYHKLDSTIVPRKYINVQHYASQQLKSPGGNNVGLGNAARLMNIPVEAQLHKAINDAYYTVEIFKKIHEKDIQPKIYDYNDSIKTKKQEIKKHMLDTDKLIAQFEKIFSRKMSNEEKIIIKLAYKMGSSKQFQKQEI
jgi:inhibitor of KinA sporulation pathway (predicted exonuclease)